LPQLGFTNDITGEIDSDIVFETIDDWLSECENSHTSCSGDNLSPPKRLVHVKGDLPTPKLRLFVDISEPLRYIALSHCWGLSTPFTTTTETLAERMAGISWEELPQTFKDAATVALKLDIHYLWIDSLCIVQNDM